MDPQKNILSQILRLRCIIDKLVYKINNWYLIFVQKLFKGADITPLKGYH